MDWQFIIVGLILGIAAFYVGHRLLNKVKAARKNSACDIGCGCDAKSKNIFAKSGRN